jgi:hypothetical protein
VKESVYIEATQKGQQHQDQTEAAVSKKTGIDEPRELVFVARSFKLRNVAHQGGPNSEIEDAIITRQGEDQNPQAEGFVPEMVKDKGREKKADGNVHRQAPPTRGDILQGPGL